MNNAMHEWEQRSNKYTIKHTCEELGITRGQAAVWGPTGKQCTFVARCDDNTSGERWYSFFTDKNRTMGHATRVYWVLVDPAHAEGVLHAEP